MDNNYKATIAALQGQVVSKGVDYSQLMVAELQSGWGLNYRQEQTNFVADQWFPMIGVDKIAGLFPKWGKANAFTPRAGTWRPGTTPTGRAQGRRSRRICLPEVRIHDASRSGYSPTWQIPRTASSA